MKHTLMCFIILVFASCITQEKCLDKYPPVGYDSIVVRDSIVHDTIVISQPYEELFFAEDIPISPSIEFHKVTKKKGLTSTITIKNGKVTAICKQDSLEKELIKERIQRVVVRTQLKIVTQEVEVIPWLYKASGWGSLLLLIVWLGTIAVYELGKDR